MFGLNSLLFMFLLYRMMFEVNSSRVDDRGVSYT